MLPGLPIGEEERAGRQRGQEGLVQQLQHHIHCVTNVHSTIQNGNIANFEELFVTQDQHATVVSVFIENHFRLALRASVLL